MKRILIVKLWALGDVLMATPMIAALRARWPDIHIAWAIENVHADILRGHPGIDELIPLDTTAWRRRLRRGDVAGWLGEARALRGQMRTGRFDAVINCHPDKWWSALLCVAPARLADYPGHPDLSRFLYTQVVSNAGEPPAHNTKRSLAATRALGCPDAGYAMTIGETSDEEPFWREFLTTHGLSRHHPTVVLAPFANSENRCWEPDRYAALAEWLYGDRQMQVILTLGPNDVAASSEIARRSSAPIVLAAGTTLRQYVSLVRHAVLMVSGDSSPMHLAAAVGTPYIALFGPTPHEARAPLVGAGRVLQKPLPCAPCDHATCANPVFRQCLLLIDVADVQRAIGSVLPALVAR